ncbi:hypothetical protein L6452_32194 [Arctium lappa]|uniref:Uncharacterized protein n=1 Tax=Arctium lappa TaxID=4217 RepID=A0ACB8Z858_ARCLA|nr:hypothetical protein L6452_32194 [Arctium lappa]
MLLRWQALERWISVNVAVESKTASRTRLINKAFPEKKDGTSPPALLRHYRIKWWDKYSTDKADAKVVQEFYSKIQYPPSPVHSPSNYPEEDKVLVSRIQACSSPAEIAKIINEIKNYPAATSQPENFELFQDAQDPFDEDF